MAKERYDIGSDVDMCNNTLYNAKIDGASCVVPKDSNSHTHDNRDALDKVSGENTGDEDKASIVQKLAITSEDVVGDSDELLADRGGNFIKVAFSKVKALLKTFFDNEYSDRSHNHNLNDLAEKSYNSLTDTPSLDFEPANANIQLHIGDGDIHVTSLQKEDFHAHTNKTALDAVSGVNTGDQSSSDFDIKDLSDTTSLRSTWSGKQDALTFSTNIETDKESTTKISAIKTFYDWAVAKFLLATKLVTSWSGTPSNDNIPSEKLVYDELVDLDANKYDKNAVDLLLGAKEDITNKSSNIDTDKTSTTKYANVKAIYDWAVGKFIDITKIVTTWTSTTLNTNIPSEKLVKDSLDLKANLSGGNSISGNQNFDSNTLFVDSVNHRVGVGNNAPTKSFHVSGDIINTGNYISSGDDIQIQMHNGYYTVFRGVRAATAWIDSKDTQWFQIGNTYDYVAFTSKSGTPIKRYGIFAATTQISPTSGANVPTGLFEISDKTNPLFNVLLNGNVGIGTTTPATKLDVNGTSNFADNMNILSTKNQYLAASPTSDTVNDIRVRNDSGVLKTERCTVANATKGAGTWVDESKAEVVKFENISVTTWVADTTYNLYPYKSEIIITGILSTDIIEIVFGHNEAVSGYYSPICLVDNGKITIYGKVNATITIPLIIKFKQ